MFAQLRVVEITTGYFGQCPHPTRMMCDHMSERYTGCGFTAALWEGFRRKLTGLFLLFLAGCALTRLFHGQPEQDVQTWHHWNCHCCHCQHHLYPGNDAKRKGLCAKWKRGPMDIIQVLGMGRDSLWQRYRNKWLHQDTVLLFLQNY